MKKNILFTPAILAAGILLAGCGTADLTEEEPEAVNPAETPEETDDNDKKPKRPKSPMWPRKRKAHPETAMMCLMVN